MRWEPFVVAAMGFAFVAIYQQQWSKMSGQEAAPIAGVALTNALLGAILAVLVFR